MTLSRVYSVRRSGLCLRASITTTWLQSLIDISIDTHDTYDDNDNDDDDDFDTGNNGHGSAVRSVLLLILVIMTDSGSQ